MKKPKSNQLLIIILSSAFYVNCGGKGPLETTSSTPPTCTSNEMACGTLCIPIVTPDIPSLHREVVLRGCAGSNSCHTGSNPKEKLNLETEEDILSMVNLQSLQRTELSLVEPSEPEMSYLIHKLRGQNMSEKSSTGNSSKIMPRLAPPLCEEVIQVFEQWIRDGAQ